mmetsp:Transcript_4998/g.12953  ORF Transcript_4998/g.12953 Transcript_4998/m.12953 type:complete len:478 (-) Transcript_4998:129-1562(-)
MSVEMHAGRFPAETPAPIVIKSPAPELNDIPIEGVQLGWTVRQLKKHLTAVYPSKPKASKQRLIYGGRALKDHQKLSDILRQFQPGIKQHMHLVVAGMQPSTPKRPPSTPRPLSGPEVLASPPSGLRRRAVPEQGHSAQTPTAATAALSPGVGTPSAMGGMTGGPHDFALQHQLHQLAVLAHQHAGYAQQFAAMGYPTDAVAAYTAHAAYYSQWYRHLAVNGAAVAGGSPFPVNSPTFGAAAVSEAPDTRRVTSGAAQEQATAGDENDVAADAAADDGAAAPFAQAGHAADAGFVDRDEPVNRNQLTLGARILEQVALILKLAFFLVYFGSHVGGWRYATLVLLCIATLLYQGGWIQRGDRNGAPPRPPPAEYDADEGRAEPDVGEDVAAEADGGVDNDGADDRGLDADNDEDDRPDAGEDGAQARDGDAAVVPTAAAMIVPPAVVAPRPVRRVVANIVYKFFASLVPGMLDGPRGQ